MSTHSIAFYEEIGKITISYRQILPFILSSGFLLLKLTGLTQSNKQDETITMA